MKRFILTLLVFLTACVPQPTSPPTKPPTETPARVVPTPRYDVPTQGQVTVTPEATATKRPTSTPRVEATKATATAEDNSWMNLPVQPEPGTNVRAIYEKGLELGNDPRAFSIFGDCQAEPQEFLGIYDTDPALVASLSPELQETVENFAGSFNRESPTAQDGTTPGALLWDQWHRGEYGCQFGETPVDCELRIHRPSFVIIQIGSHFESRNAEYLRRVINQLLENGVVPILATKADNRELDHRINRDMAMLADEFDLPLWNFWAALSNLPNRGLFTREDRPLQGDIYLTDEAKVIHRETGLEALNIAWRMAVGN
ncbi:MAG: hypothetical protein HYU84_00600 [Chloroflexi bacterium]|nr:hypothetical protein [Chloroflexota bacterium]MBI3168449.1 hypothetical protein [Chloroflexota bacterium]